MALFLLLFISYNLLTGEGEDLSKIQASPTLMAAVRTIVFADIVMGFDNVLAVAGAAHGNIILVVLGLIVSIPIIIWGSKLIFSTNGKVLHSRLCRLWNF
ncbi:hypothetical protein GCM10020331_078380 [Ectobacillus funiculus]